MSIYQQSFSLFNLYESKRGKEKKEKVADKLLRPEVSEV